MSQLLVKDCVDFIPLKDGTFRGDERFCDLSFKCRQVGMISEKIEMTMPDGTMYYELLCTGNKSINEKDKDINK